MDLPRQRGLAPEVGNLLILAFAEQTDRGFYLRGRPFSPTLEHMPDELELRTQPLPGEAEWEEAKRRADEVFGVKDFEAAMRTAANVAALAGKVRETGRGRPGRRSTTWSGRSARPWPAWALSDAEIGPGPALPDRPGGRRAAGRARGPGRRRPPWNTWPQAPLATSGSAMATSLANAAGVVRALRDAKWDLFDGVARPRRRAARRRPRPLIEALRKALESDEYVDAPGAAPRRGRDEGHPAPGAPRGREPAVDVDRDGSRTGGEGPGSGSRSRSGHAKITAENWDAEIARLAALLKDGDGRDRLVLTWTLEREEESP